MVSYVNSSMDSRKDHVAESKSCSDLIEYLKILENFQKEEDTLDKSTDCISAKLNHELPINVVF